jgi:hypothetical protein
MCPLRFLADPRCIRRGGAPPTVPIAARQIEATRAGIRKKAEFVRPMHTLAISTHESGNRFLECAEAAEADYLVTRNARHFPRPFTRRPKSSPDGSF